MASLSPKLCETGVAYRWAEQAGFVDRWDREMKYLFPRVLKIYCTATLAVSGLAKSLSELNACQSSLRAAQKAAKSLTRFILPFYSLLHTARFSKIHCTVFKFLSQILPALPPHRDPKCAPGRKWNKNGISTIIKYKGSSIIYYI